MKDYLLAIIGIGGAIFGFAEFLINRKDKKVETDYKNFEKRLDGISSSQYRTEMLVMMNHYPTQTIEIMKLAKHYFVDLKGDFYMTSLFAKWLKEYNIEKPLWFNEND